ncbi:hypothetical protein RB598_003499 [Gaeumannomyces tritici]
MLILRWHHCPPGCGSFVTFAWRLKRAHLPSPNLIMPPETRRTRSAATAASQKAKALAATIASSPSPAPTSAASTLPPDKAAAAAAAAAANSTSGGDSTAPSPPVMMFPDARAFEAWLEQNPDDTAGLWLKFAKKGCDTPTVTYDEALDAALCFGWIDSQVRPLDARFYLQRFTPRRRRSLWSKRNVAKVARLTAAGRMRARGRAEVDTAVADGRWGRAYLSGANVEVPPDLQAALDADGRGAAAFFAGLGKTKRYSILWRIETVKREETRRRKIAQFVDMLARGETI